MHVTFQKLRRALKDSGLGKESRAKSMNPNLPLSQQVQLMPLNDKWEFPLKDLSVEKLLGAGEFGTVMKAQARFIKEGETITTVAVKIAKMTPDLVNVRALAMEMKILANVGSHLNVVNLLGVCTKCLLNKKLMMIVEYCRFGNLRSFLFSHQEAMLKEFETRSEIHSSEIVTEPRTSMASNSSRRFGQGVDTPVSQTMWMSEYQHLRSGPPNVTDLICWSYQVARGMEFLSSRKVLHGDLAARNVLLADNNVVKICDFGLARSLSSTGYYRKKDDDLLPAKWMSPEALTQQIFTIYSDVWAFGVLLWEIFSCGDTPYSDISPFELCTKLKNGYRLSQPKLAPEVIYSIMVRCWNRVTTDRPVFSTLSNDFGNLIEESTLQIYLQLNKPYIKLNALRKDLLPVTADSRSDEMVNQAFEENESVFDVDISEEDSQL